MIASRDSLLVARSLIIVVLLVLELFQDGVELVEAVRPETLVVLDPVVDGLERAAVEAVQPPPSVLADGDDIDLAEHPQVLRDLRLGEAERLDEVVHGPLAAGQEVEDLPPPGLRHVE